MNIARNPPPGLLAVLGLPPGIFVETGPITGVLTIQGYPVLVTYPNINLIPLPATLVIDSVAGGQDNGSPGRFAATASLMRNRAAAAAGVMSLGPAAAEGRF